MCILSYTETIMQATKFIEDLYPFSHLEAKKFWDLKGWCRMRIEACKTKLEDYEREENFFKVWLLSPIL